MPADTPSQRDLTLAELARIRRAIRAIEENSPESSDLRELARAMQDLTAVVETSVRDSAA